MEMNNGSNFTDGTPEPGAEPAKVERSDENRRQIEAEGPTIHVPEILITERRGVLVNTVRAIGADRRRSERRGYGEEMSAEL